MGFNRIRILPLLVLVAFMSFGVRLGDVVTGVRTMDQAMSVSAIAEEEKKESNTSPVEIPPGVPADQAAQLPDEKWADPSTEDLSYMGNQGELLNELVERRKTLDERENALNQREALVKAAEKQVEQKIAQLTQLRGDIEVLLGKQSEAEESRLNSLVKVYEGMKAKDAATIFNTLDMDILLQVVGRMSERKTSPILAEMDPQRARELTVLLVEQKKLPDLP